MIPQEDRIEIGDHVQVCFNNSSYTLTTRAVVLYMPCNTGDSWTFKDWETGKIWYISEGCTITLIEKAPKQ